MNAQSFLPFIQTLAILAAVVVFWRSGANRATQEVIVTYEKQVSQLKEEVATMHIKFNDLTQQLGHLQGVVAEKDAKLKEYIEILQNRNPELESFMKMVSEMVKKSTVYMEESKKSYSRTGSMVQEMYPLIVRKGTAGGAPTPT